MRAPNHKIIVLAVSILLSFSTCRPVPICRPNLGPLPKPEEALQRLRKRASQIHGLQSMGRVTYFGERGRIRLRAVLVAERPAKFRIETLSPLEQPIQVMVSDGNRLRLLAEGRFYEGQSTARNLSRILPVPLSPSTLVDVLMMGVPMDAQYRADHIEWADSSGERGRLTLTSTSIAHLVLDYDVATNTVRRLRMPTRASQAEVVIEFERFEALPPPLGLNLAHRIKIRLPTEEHEVTLKLKDVAVNVGINPSFFELSPPAGITPINLDLVNSSTTSDL